MSLTADEIDKKAVSDYFVVNDDLQEPLPKDRIKSSVKIVIKEEGVGYIIGKNGSFTKYMQDKLNVYLKCYRDKYNRTLK